MLFCLGLRKQKLKVFCKFQKSLMGKANKVKESTEFCSTLEVKIVSYVLLFEVRSSTYPSEYMEKGIIPLKISHLNPSVSCNKMRHEKIRAYLLLHKTLAEQARRGSLLSISTIWKHYISNLRSFQFSCRIRSVSSP